MSRLIELREAQARILTHMRGVLDTITDKSTETEVREKEAEYGKAEVDFDALQARIDREEKLEARSAIVARPVAERPDADEVRQVGRAIEAAKVDEKELFRRWVQFGTESFNVDEKRAFAEFRAQTTATTGGGYTIPQGFSGEIEKSMLAFGPMLDPGVTRQMSTPTGNTMMWPTIDDTGNVGRILAENTQVTETALVFGQKQLDAYTYSSDLILVPLQLVQDSAFNLDREIIVPAFGERIGRIVNSHLTTGTGTSQPNGIVTAAGAGVTAASATAVTADELLDLVHSIDPAYRSAGNVKWMFNDTVLKAVRKLKDGQSNYLWQMGDVRGGSPATLWDHPYVINQAMPAMTTGLKPIVFGDFSKYVVRRVKEFTMIRMVERYADYLQIGYVAFGRFDGELLNTAAVKRLLMA